VTPTISVAIHKDNMKRIKQFAIVIFGLLATVAIVFAMLWWRSNAKVEAAISTLRDAGEPVCLADLEPDLIPGDENAATYLVPIAADAEKLVSELYPIANPDDFTWRVGLSEIQVQKSAEILNAFPQVPAGIEKASQCNRLMWELDYTVQPSEFTSIILESISVSRSFARVQVCRAHHFAASGKPDEAAVVVLQGLRLVRLQDEIPTLVASTVNTACRGEMLDQLNGLLQTAKLTPETHQAIEQELAKQDPAGQFTQMLKTERAFGIESFRGFPQLIGVNSQLDNYLDFLADQIELNTKSPFEITNIEPVMATGMTELIVPALTIARTSMENTRAKLRCLRVLNSLIAQAKKTPPENITELGLPSEATVDPYSGKPLIVKSTETGWIVYSVGLNADDDGGQVAADDATSASKDLGFAPP
jgi:hypothetical protein